MAGPGNLPVGAEPDNVGTPVPHGPPRYLGPPTKSHLAQVGPYVEKKFLPQLHPWRRGTLITQGPTMTTVLVAGVGEQVADGYPYDVLCAYSSSTVGALGGPQAGDDLHIGHTGTEKQYVAGYFPKKGTVSAPLPKTIQGGQTTLTITSLNRGTASISFSPAYVNPPIVLVSMVGWYGVTVYGVGPVTDAEGITATGFTHSLYNPLGTTQALVANWLSWGS